MAGLEAPVQPPLKVASSSCWEQSWLVLACAIDTLKILVFEWTMDWKMEWTLEWTMEWNSGEQNSAIIALN